MTAGSLLPSGDIILKNKHPDAAETLSRLPGKSSPTASHNALSIQRRNS